MNPANDRYLFFQFHLSRATAPDVRITMGGNNAGFTSLTAALVYLEATEEEIGYVIHDANHTLPSSSDRIGQLAHALTLEVPGFEFLPQTFNTPALLGEMGAGTALTNVALAIRYANHLGKPVLVAGTSDSDSLTGVLVSPPARVRPIDHGKPWFRARGEHHAYLPWWGIGHDHADTLQGWSQ